MSEDASPPAPGALGPDPVRAAIAVLIAATHAVVRSGYRRILENEPGLRVVAEAANTNELLAGIAREQPAVVLLDLSLPPAGGLDATRQILARRPGTAVLIFAASGEGGLALRSLDVGAMGFIGQDSDAATVASAVRRLARGEPFLESGLMQQVALQRVAARSDALASLSTREFEVFRLLTAGRPVSEVARALALSPRSVANYQTQIKRKLGVATTAELVHLAIRRGVIRVDEA
jgi:two-component system invasion response regulator UvrY